MRVLSRSWQGMLAVAVAGALVGAAGADDQKSERPRDAAARMRGEAMGLRLEKLPDGKMQVILGDGAIRVIVAGDAPHEALRKALQTLEKVQDPLGATEAERRKAETKAREAQEKARQQAGQEKGPADFIKGRVVVLEAHKDQPARDKMAILVKRQQELIEQAGQIVKKMQGLMDGQQAEARELMGQFERVQAQLRELTHAAAAARSGPEARGIEVELRGAGQFQSQGGQSQSQSQSQRGGEKKVIVNVAPKPGAEGPTTAGGKLRMTLPAPAAEVKELKEQMKALKEQVEDLRAMLKALAEREKAREKP